MKKLFICGILSGMLLLSASCNKDDDNNNPQQGKGSFLLSLSGESTSYLMLAESLDGGELSINNNNVSLEKTGYTWIFNDNPSVALGLIYQQGDPGICLGYRLATDGTLERIGEFDITSRYTSYGFFGDYALTSVSGQKIASTDSSGVTFNFINANNLVRKETSISTLNITGNGELATFSGVVDMGNGEFLTGLVVSQPKDPASGGGASTGIVTYPDSVWVALYATNLTQSTPTLSLRRIYRSGKLSYSAGRMRSQYYSQIGKADDGTVYVFSGAYESRTTNPCGALRINKNATDFDAGYYFNIEEKTGGYRFRKVWHITGDYFLLEFYNTTTVSATGAATQYGVVNMTAKTFAWVTGIPAKEDITDTGLPMAYDGKMYFPITAAGVDPTVYIIDPVTAAATKGLSVTGAAGITAVGRLNTN